MELNFNSEKAIYQQLSEIIEDAILSGAFSEGSQIPSTTEISVTYNINPATALKGVNLLVDGKIIYKKRGVGMFVANGASEEILKKRQEEFFHQYIETMLAEAKKLGINREDIINMIKGE